MERSHDVVTGVALLGADDVQPERFADAAVVNMRRVAAGDLEEYLDSGQWRGKAGGYNLFDRQRAGWPMTVEGDPTTVVGLPMTALRAALARRGVAPQANAANASNAVP
ncbi:MAG: Maf family protein [Planctomycetota bacterium]|nr:Maf family protein [Planctomycetota bacterium]